MGGRLGIAAETSASNRAFISPPLHVGNRLSTKNTVQSCFRKNDMIKSASSVLTVSIKVNIYCLLHFKKCIL